MHVRSWVNMFTINRNFKSSSWSWCEYREQKACFKGVLKKQQELNRTEQISRSITIIGVLHLGILHKGPLPDSMFDMHVNYIVTEVLHCLDVYMFGCIHAKQPFFGLSCSEIQGVYYY